MMIPCCDNDNTCGTVTWLTDTLPNATDDAPYSQQLYALGLTPPIRYYLSGGALPPGLTLSVDGVISGTPTENGDYEFQVQASDQNRCIGFQDFTISVEFPLFLITEGGDQLITQVADNYISN